MDDPAAAYDERFRRVLAYVDGHLDESLSVERLAEVAAFSKFHFHRQFSARFGLSVHTYVQLVRTRFAAHRLAYYRDDRILDLALATGYESHEAFTRAFRKLVGQTPSEFRDAPAWNDFHAVDERLTAARDRARARVRADSAHNATYTHDPAEHAMAADPRIEDVTCIDFPETPVAVLEHRGDPRQIGDTLRRFIRWRKANGLSPKVSGTFNLLYGDPSTTPPDAFRLDLCAETRTVAENDEGIVLRTIPAGRCAKLVHVGSDDGLGASFDFLYRTWLPTSGEELRDFPLFMKRIRFFPDVSENEAEIEIYLPLR